MSITISINNSYSQIQGITVEQHKALRKLLRYEDNPNAKYFGKGYATYKHLIDKKGYFPTGLLKLVSPLHPTAQIKDNRVQPKIQPSIPLTGVKPYDWQEKAAYLATYHHRGGIVAVTGTGKSLVIGLIASRLNVKTLVVVPSIEIKNQLIASIDALIGKGHKVVVENIDSKRLQTLTGFDCLIIDECHHAAAKTYQSLNKKAWRGIYYRYFLSATFFRNETNEQLLFEGIAGSVIYELTYREAILKKYICPVEAYYYKLPKVTTDAYTYREVYNELVINNEYRNSLISLTLLRLNAERKSTLCLVREVAHGNILSEMTGIPFANGKDEESRKYIEMFKEGKITSLIGTNGIIGEGVDTKPCEFVVIAGLGKAKSAFMQQVGRAVRRYNDKESAKVILFQDKSHRFTSSHFNTQVKILLDEYRITPVLLPNE